MGRKKLVKNYTGVDFIQKALGAMEKSRYASEDGQLQKAVSKLVNKDAPGRHKAPKKWDPDVWAFIMRGKEIEKLVIAGALIAMQIDILLKEEK